MFRKGVIAVSDTKGDQFLSSLFLLKKRDGRNCPVVNLKNLNSNILYQHFKMEGLFLLKEMFLPGDKMFKIDLKDAYFVIPLSVKSRKYFRYQWKGLPYEFCLLWVFSRSSGLCKVIKSPYLYLPLSLSLSLSLSLLRKLSVRIIIYLNDIS